MNTDIPILFAGLLLLANERMPSNINAPTSKHKTNQTADLIKFKILFFIIYSIWYIYALNELFDFFNTIQYMMKNKILNLTKSAIWFVLCLLVGALIFEGIRSLTNSDKP